MPTFDSDESEPIPNLSTAPQEVHIVLKEFLRTVKAFHGRGQGWSGHLLTYAKALVDLQELGYADLVDDAQAAFKLYVKRTRMGPLETDIPRPEHPRLAFSPLEKEYWVRRSKGGLGMGHLFKYPYGFYGLTAISQDPQLVRECMDASHALL